jgi:hypothetical protein
VLRGQCVRSQAGLYYENQPEFTETLKAMTDSRTLNAALGRNGRRFFDRHYSWPVIERKYLDMLNHLSAEDRGAVQNVPASRTEREPGWLARRRKVLLPAREVLAALPAGPVVEVTEHVA